MRDFLRAPMTVSCIQPEKETRVPIGDTTSSRIEALRFPLIVGVVFIHGAAVLHTPSGVFDFEHTQIPWVDFIVSISQYLVDVSVPLFFAISGYLFFSGEWSWKNYSAKLRRRIHTLLIPFLFWSLATLAVLAAAESIPQTRMYFADATWPEIHSLSFFRCISVLFGIFEHYPLLHPFWFLRDLMALVVFAPLIHFVFHNKRGGLFLVALFIWLYGPLWLRSAWPILWPSLVSVFYFSLGAYLAQTKSAVASIDKIGPWTSLAFLIIFILNYVLPSSQSKLIFEFLISLVAPSVWWLIGFADRSIRWSSALVWLSGDAFFVYAIHQPLLVILRKIVYKLFLPTSGMAILAHYFLVPICLIALLVVLHRALLKVMPGFIGVVTGNSYRSQRRCAS
jgi:surface polysaccharide O-acyltransferase-like enzyme